MIDIEQRLCESRTENINTTVTVLLTHDQFITSLINDVRDLRSRGTTTQQKTGFGQPESKDFSILFNP
jgi:hypothetical protein